MGRYCGFHGCVREVDELEDMNLGIQALASIPVGASQEGVGELMYL